MFKKIIALITCREVYLQCSTMCNHFAGNRSNHVNFVSAQIQDLTNQQLNLNSNNLNLMQNRYFDLYSVTYVFEDYIINSVGHRIFDVITPKQGNGILWNFLLGIQNNMFRFISLNVQV